MGEPAAYVRFHRDPPIVIGDVDPVSMADIKQMSAFGDFVVAAVGKHRGVALLLSFERVPYLSSAALTELIRIRETQRGQGGALRVCGLSPDLYKVFEITRLADDFSIRPGERVAEAAERFKRDVAASARRAGGTEE